MIATCWGAVSHVQIRKEVWLPKERVLLGGSTRIGFDARTGYRFFFLGKYQLTRAAIYKLGAGLFEYEKAIPHFILSPRRLHSAPYRSADPPSRVLRCNLNPLMPKRYFCTSIQFLVFGEGAASATDPKECLNCRTEVQSMRFFC